MVTVHPYNQLQIRISCYQDIRLYKPYIRSILNIFWSLFIEVKVRSSKYTVLT